MKNGDTVYRWGHVIVGLQILCERQDDDERKQ
jgi:hypothetical protein